MAILIFFLVLWTICKAVSGVRGSGAAAPAPVPGGDRPRMVTRHAVSVSRLQVNPVAAHSEQIAILREQRKALNEQLFAIEQAIASETDTDKRLRLMNRQAAIYNQLQVNQRKVDKLLFA